MGNLVSGVFLLRHPLPRWREGKQWFDPTAHNPFFDGPFADLLAMLPFAALSILLYLVSCEALFSPKR
jgi:hypothetical protein